MSLNADNIKTNVRSMTGDVGRGISRAAPPNKTQQDAEDELVDQIAEVVVRLVDDLPWYVSWAVNERWVSRLISVVYRAIDSTLDRWSS